MPTWQTHNNGDRPFQVIHDKRAKTVQNNVRDDDEDKYNRQKIFQNVQKVFVGRDTMDYAKDSMFDGNTIVLQQEKDRPKFIAIMYDTIFIFDLKDDTLVKQYSDMGNLDVPYPIVVGKLQVYLFAVSRKNERIIKIPKKQFDGLNIQKDAQQMYQEDRFQNKQTNFFSKVSSKLLLKKK